MDITEAIGDKNRDLYNRIKSSHKEIKFEPSKDSSWSCLVVNGIITISYASTEWKEAALTHELLHADTQLKGYKKIFDLIPRDDLSGNELGLMKNIIMACDNEFQHIKMFPAFKDLKFNETEFYCDDDLNTESHLRESLTTLQHNLMSLATELLSVLAPGGHLSESAKNELLNLIRNFDNGKYKKEIAELENVINKWTASEEFDAEPFIKEYLKISGVDNVWVSYISNVTGFTENGYFPNSPFTIEDYHKARSKA